VHVGHRANDDKRLFSEPPIYFKRNMLESVLSINEFFTISKPAYSCDDEEISMVSGCWNNNNNNIGTVELNWFRLIDWLIDWLIDGSIDRSIDEIKTKTGGVCRWTMLYNG